MNVKVPVVLLLLIGVILGYAFATESGGAQRQALLTKLGRTQVGDAASSDSDESDPSTSSDAT
jgi:hypothetical protein